MSDPHGDAGDVADQPQAPQEMQHGAVAPPPLPLPGWYRDPWSSGHHRYWDGHAWTPDVFADVPPIDPAATAWPAAAPAPAPPAPPTPGGGIGGPPQPGSGGYAGPAPPPQWLPPIDPDGLETLAPAMPMPPAPVSAPRGRNRTRVVAVLVALGLVTGVTGFAFGAAIERARQPKRPSAAPLLPLPTVRPPGQFPGGTIAPAPNDPITAALGGLVVHQSDLDPAFTVSPIPGGTQVEGQVTLDVCNADYPSEQLRTNRLQVVARNDQGDTALSTEAVAYRSGDATAQAFTELKAAAANCPAGPVTSPVGEPTSTTHFNAAPDANWPATATVDRVAFDMVTTDDAGDTNHSAAVYLRRGRVLLGLYFHSPDGPLTVGGKTDIPGIVGLFAGRMAALPASVVG